MTKIITLIIVLFTFSAAASTEKPEATRLYRVYWSGLHIADLAASVKGNKVDTIIESYGIVRKVSKYRSKTQSKFDFADGRFVPLSFYAEFTQRNGGRSIDIKYDESGNIIHEKVTPPDKRYKRPAVEDEMKINTVDPLTAFLAARLKLIENMQAGKQNFSFNMYDGRRLSRLDFKIKGRYERDFEDHGKQKIIEVAFRRNPVAGYTDNELERIDGEEPDFTVFLTDDDKLLPIKVDAKAKLGTAVLLYDKDCDDIEVCI